MSSARIRSSPTLATATTSANGRGGEPPTCDEAGVGYFFGGYDVHADVLLGGYRLATSTTEVLAFYVHPSALSLPSAHLPGQ